MPRKLLSRSRPRLKPVDKQSSFKIQTWQKEDLDYLDARDHSANWSSMGTYKTSTGLWLLERKIPDSGNALVITTKSGKGAYYDCLPRTLDISQWRILDVTTTGVEELNGQARSIGLVGLLNILRSRRERVIILTHYNLFSRRDGIGEHLVCASKEGKILWDFVLLDEAHRIKNRKAKWTQAIKELSRHAKHRHVMTGTGFINDPSEIWSLLNFLEPQRFRSYWQFRWRYCREEEWSGFRKVVGIRENRIDEFIALRKEFGPRRTMEEVHSDIHQPIETKIGVELSSVQRRMYDETVRYLRMLDQQGYPIRSPNVVAQIQRLRQVTAATPELEGVEIDGIKPRQIVRLVEPSSKLDAVMEIIESIGWDAENRRQVVVFSVFRDTLELLKVRLKKAGVTYIHLEQRDSDQVRFEKWHELFPRKEHQVFLSTIDLGGESINLTPASYCIFIDKSWSPAKNAQAVGRVYRPGQRDVVEIFYIHANRTIDTKVESDVKRKVNWFHLLFDDVA